MTIQEKLERVLALSKADACIVIGHRSSGANIRWANNTTTTNGTGEGESLSIVSIIGKRVGSVNRNHFPDDRLEDLVRESEAACETTPEAPDYMPLIEGSSAPGDWDEPAEATGIAVFERFAPDLAAMFERARSSGLLTFGYAEHDSGTVWLATSTGLRKRHSERSGKVEVTGKTPDFARSAWTGRATTTFADVDTQAMFDTLERRLEWSKNQIALPAGNYETLLEASATADMALGAYRSMTRRDADEGRSVYSRAGGGNRIGEKLFGGLTLYADPHEPDLETTPFGVGVGSSGASSVFDNGLEATKTEWVRDGVLQTLIMPRWWAEKTGAPAPVPYIDNLVIPSEGPTLEQMIASTKRALLVTCMWYIRTVDPQTALQTGLTRDGVFLLEDGEVRGAVNNFRWNMSPVGTFAQAIEYGRSSAALPRENDTFLLAKAPPVRVENFNMSSVSEAT